MNRKVISIILSLLMLFTLAGPIGCGDDRPLYTVTFVENGGSEVAPLKLRAGDKLKEPKAPVRELYDFGGWYAGENLEYKYPFGVMPASDLTLYAKWNPYKVRRLTFVTNGGTPVEPIDGVEGEIFDAVTTRQNYTFGGWYLDKALSLEFGENIIPATDALLYAKWILSVNSAEVTFDAGGKTAVVTVEKGEKVTAPVLFGSEYELDGWYKDKNFGERADLNQPVEASATLYARVWSKGQNLSGESLVSFEGGKDVIVKPGVKVIEASAFAGNQNVTSVALPAGVTKIGAAAFADCKNLLSVTLPNGVTEIEDGAFAGCARLKSISLPEGLLTIGESAFAGCENLTNVAVPEGVTDIGRTAFSDCVSIKEVVLPSTLESIGDYAFSNLPLITEIVVPARVSYLGKRAFAFDKSLASIEIEAGNLYYTEDNGNIFNKEKTHLIYYVQGAKQETSYSVPEGVLSIAEGAFANNTNLTALTLPASVTSYERGVLADMKALASLKVAAFKGYDYLAYLFGAPTALANGADSAYVPKTLASVVLTGEMNRIPEYAFYGCKSLVSITYPDASVSEIGTGAFAYTGLTGFAVPKDVTKDTLGSSAFLGCANLASFTADAESVAFSVSGGCLYNKDGSELIKAAPALTNFENLPAKLRTIKSRAFEQSKVVKIVVPSTVEIIEKTAFDRCVNLEEITVPFIGRKLPDSPAETDYASYSFLPYIFGATKTVSGGSVNVDAKDFVPASLKKITVTGNIIEIPDYAFFYCNVPTIKYPSSVTKIGAHAFHVNDKLTEIVIPPSVTEVGTYAFAETAAKKVTIPATLKTMGQLAFGFNSNLEEIVVEEGVTSLGVMAFTAFNYTIFNSGAVNNGTYPEAWGGNLSKIKKISLPASLERIGEFAFMGAGVDGQGVYQGADGQVHSSTTYSATGAVLEIASGSKLTVVGDSAFSFSGFIDIKLPASVTGIGDSAFSGSPFLTDVTIGDESQTSALESIGASAFYAAVALRNIYLYKSAASVSDVPVLAVDTSNRYPFDNLGGAHMQQLTIHVPKDSVSVYRAASGWSTYSEIIASL